MLPCAYWRCELGSGSNRPVHFERTRAGAISSQHTPALTRAARFCLFRLVTLASRPLLLPSPALLDDIIARRALPHLDAATLLAPLLGVSPGAVSTSEPATGPAGRPLSDRLALDAALRRAPAGSLVCGTTSVAPTSQSACTPSSYSHVSVGCAVGVGFGLSAGGERGSCCGGPAQARSDSARRPAQCGARRLPRRRRGREHGRPRCGFDKYCWRRARAVGGAAVRAALDGCCRGGHTTHPRTHRRSQGTRARAPALASPRLLRLSRYAASLVVAHLSTCGGPLGAHRLVSLRPFFAASSAHRCFVVPVCATSGCVRDACRRTWLRWPSWTRACVGPCSRS